MVPSHVTEPFGESDIFFSILLRAYLYQRLSLAIQRGNVASVLGTLPQGPDLGGLFYI